MATHGTMSEFKPAGKESWSNYTERLGHYFVANKVTDAEQKRAILLSACGPATFKLIKSLSDPAKLPTAMTFAEISALVKDYYQPTPSEIVQRFKFNYGTTLSEMLRDRLVCGVNHEGIQKKLLAEKDLDYAKAFSLAQAIEAAEKDTKNLKSGSGASQQGPGVTGNLAPHNFGTPISYILVNFAPPFQKRSVYRTGAGTDPFQHSSTGTGTGSSKLQAPAPVEG